MLLSLLVSLKNSQSLIHGVELAKVLNVYNIQQFVLLPDLKCLITAQIESTVLFHRTQSLRARLVALADLLAILDAENRHSHHSKVISFDQVTTLLFPYTC